MNQTHKVSVLKSKIYSKPLRRFGTKKFLPFSSEIEFLEKKNNFVKFENMEWIKLKLVDFSFHLYKLIALIPIALSVALIQLFIVMIELPEIVNIVILIIMITH